MGLKTVTCQRINQFYFREEIDTIKVWIFTENVNTKKWSQEGKPNPTPLPFVTAVRNSNFHYYIDIQAERLDHTKNIKSQVRLVLYELYYHGYFTLPKEYQNVNFITFLWHHIETVSEIAQIHFAFNFQEGAIKQNKTYNYYKGTSYSKRVRAKGDLCCYHRKSHLKSQNQTPHKRINLMPYPWRIEFRLTKRNCEYVSWGTINGNYEYIVNNFIGILSKKAKKHLAEVVHAVRFDTYHPNFNKILLLTHFPCIPHSLLPKVMESSYFKCEEKENIAKNA